MRFAKISGYCCLTAVAFLACGPSIRLDTSGTTPPAVPRPTDSEASSESATATTPPQSLPEDLDLEITVELAQRDALGAVAPASPSFSDEVPTFKEHPLRSYVRDLELEAFQAIPFPEDGEMALIPLAEEREPSLLDELNDAAIPDDFRIAENRETRLESTQSELPLTLNAQVIRLINYFTAGRGRKTFRRTMDRSEAYRSMIERILEDEGVPAEIFHLAQAESGFRPSAISRARAAGMWQFIRGTGRQYGLRQNRYVDERYDPEMSTRAAARHLKDLYLEFGHWYLAMAAYNGGPMRVVRSIKKSGSKDYWVLCRHRLLRRETRNYVPIILAMTYVAKNLWLYESFERNPAPPLRYSTVTTNSETHFRLIADITNTTTERVRELNPALRRSATPPHSYELRLPEGTSEIFETEIARIPKEKRLAWRYHKVKERETLSAIAKRYRVKPSQIAELNQLDEENLTQGFLLAIPSSPQQIKYYYRGGAGGFLVGGTGRYRIARGDTLGGIARRFGTSVRRLQLWNGLTTSRIIAGRYLIVKPEGISDPTSGRSRTSNTGKHRIRSGDNLSVIAKRHGVTVAQLKRWNGITGDRIVAGRYLVVRSPDSVPVRRRVASTPVPASGRYKIRSGDNLSTIAQRFGVTVGELRAWNKLRGSRIRAGKWLIVNPMPADTHLRYPSAQARDVSQEKTFSSTDSGSVRYEIQPGDSLGAIAKRFKVTVSQLKTWNGLRGSRIHAGEHLMIERADSKKSVRYRVRSGDSLSLIASRFGVSVGKLKAWNGLQSSRIRAGRYLVIKSSSAKNAGS